jgi:hypothetical protein
MIVLYRLLPSVWLIEPHGVSSSGRHRSLHVPVQRLPETSTLRIPSDTPDPTPARRLFKHAGYFILATLPGLGGREFEQFGACDKEVEETPQGDQKLRLWRKQREKKGGKVRGRADRRPN